MTTKSFESIGLTSAEAQRMLVRYGPNEIIPSGVYGFFHDLKTILLDPGGLLFTVLGTLYWILGDHTNAWIMYAAYVPVTLIDVLLNIRSNKALKALKGTLAVHAKTYRDGKLVEIPIRNLVPGDLIRLEEGQTLPADGMLLENHSLHISEASLTGESIPIEKKINEPFFAGTQILTGWALGKIKKTGKETRYGKIGTLLKASIESKSPLRIKIDRLFRIVFLLALGLSVLLFFVEWVRTNQIIPSLIIALTLGMSAIPEEFPIVFTLYLSWGAWRLSKKNVLVKALPAVETLGSVDVICTDKTGTLTTGQFGIEKFHGVKSDEKEEMIWKALLASEPHPVDPMEIPIHQMAGSGTETLKDWILVHDYPFDPIQKTMSHAWKNKTNGNLILSMKGAFEKVISNCEWGESEKKEWVRIHDQYTRSGKRVLGLATHMKPFTGIRNIDETGLRFEGLIVYSDPVRAEVKEAIHHCQSSGIEIKMMTGDHLLTAHSIADEIELIHSHEHLYTGEQIARMSPVERQHAFIKGAVFARFSPEQKHELVQALKAEGKVVAMTGDGINDAPALRLADIGISMGKSATDVARSTAKMILIQSDFSGIVEAVFEGRNVFSNLKKSFSYLIAFHIPVILLSLIPPFLGWPTLLMPIHIILLELVVHPVSVLTFERQPDWKILRFKSGQFLKTKQWIQAVAMGTTLSISALVLYRFKMEVSEQQARALAYFTILTGNVFLIFAEVDTWRNKRYWMSAVPILLGALLIGRYSFVSPILHFKVLGWRDLGLGFFASALPLLWTWFFSRKARN